MKRYLLFGGDCYYAVGGMHDALKACDTIEQAVAESNSRYPVHDDSGNIESHVPRYEWWHILDMETGRVVKCGGYKPYGANQEMPKWEPEEQEATTGKSVYKECPFCGASDLALAMDWDHHKCFLECRTCHSTGPAVGMANRERVRAAGEKRKLNVRFVYLADDRAEEWCELHWKRREDASDGGE